MRIHLPKHIRPTVDSYCLPWSLLAPRRVLHMFIRFTCLHHLDFVSICNSKWNGLCQWVIKKATTVAHRQTPWFSLTGKCRFNMEIPTYVTPPRNGSNTLNLAAWIPFQFSERQSNWELWQGWPSLVLTCGWKPQSSAEIWNSW